MESKLEQKASSQAKGVVPGQLQNPLQTQKPMEEVEDAHQTLFTSLRWQELNPKVCLARNTERNKPAANSKLLVAWCKMTI